MSYVSENQGANPAGLAAALLINGAVVAAAFFASVAIVPRVFEPRTKTFNVPIDQPPPMPADTIEPKVDLQKPDPVFANKPIVNIPAKPIDQISATDVMGDIPFATDSDGSKIAANIGVKDAIERILPPPVFKAATRDPRFTRNFQPSIQWAFYSVRLRAK